MFSHIFLLIGLTILFEIPVWYVGMKPKHIGQWLIFVVLLNAFTNPLANYAISGGYLNWWLTEAGVVLLEFGIAYAFWRMNAGKTFLLSLLANALSAGPGTWFYLWAFA